MRDDARALLRRHLRQLGELGETELVLDRLSRDELVGMLGRAAAMEPSRGSTPAGAAPGATQESSQRAVAPPLPEAPERAVPAPSAPAPGPAATEIVRIGDMAELRSTALGCPRCDLARTRRNVVFGEGNERAEVVVVGEAPGADEDRSGRPFIGRAGQLLDRLLASVGFPREAVYICNVLKCRPPANRNPQPEEIEACSPYLLRQVELVAPKVILTVGTFAAQTLLDSREPISRLRGQVHRWRGIPVIPTYHPAALLRNPGWIRPTWEDLQRLRVVLDGDASIS